MSPESRTRRPVQDDATTRIPNSDPTTPTGYPTQAIRDQLGDWWTDPALAYWVGLQDGVELAQRHDEEVHRATVQGIGRFIEAADRRTAFNRGEVAA